MGVKRSFEVPRTGFELAARKPCIYPVPRLVPPIDRRYTRWILVRPTMPSWPRISKQTCCSLSGFFPQTVRIRARMPKCLYKANRLRRPNERAQCVDNAIVCLFEVDNDRRVIAKAPSFVCMHNIAPKQPLHESMGNERVIQLGGPAIRTVLKAKCLHVRAGLRVGACASVQRRSLRPGNFEAIS